MKMKKILNTILIASVLVAGTNFAFAKKIKSAAETNLEKKDKEIQIIAPEKEVKVNQKKEIKSLNQISVQKLLHQKKLKVCMKLSFLQLIVKFHTMT